MAELHILLVEDDPLDAELIIRELRKSGYDPRWQRVDTQAEFVNCLAQDPPDVIISDHAMPQFSSIGALQCLQESGLTIPFIVVSHAIGEEEAVELMRKGAADYLLKNRLARLGEAVRHGLEEQRLRSKCAEAQQKLRLLNQELENRIVERTTELEVANRTLARELSERKQIEDRLRQLTGTLEERVKERTQQLSMSSARLRALATDLTVAEQTERRRLATELHDYLAQLLVVTRMKVAQLLNQDHDSEARKILQDADELLHQSLDYTRSLVSELTPQALYERGLGAALRWLADQMCRQQMLTVEVSLDAPELSLPEADAVLLFHSIRELLFNVLKHGKTNRASVSMRYAQNVLSITVLDHGCGFDVTRLHDDPSDRFGLLSIRERMTALGGSFDLQSEPGKGTVASLHLPFPASGESIETRVAGGKGRTPLLEAALRRPPEPGTAALAPEEAYVVTPLRVMIVDDFELVRKSLRSHLDQYDDLTVIGEASSGAQAVQLACALGPDVIVMDMHMPDLNGADATRQILKDQPDTVVIGLSVQTDPDIAKSMMDAGAAAFITKDSAVNELYVTLREAARRKRSSRPTTSRSPV
ncbi:MAG TPA: response regulator [Nitrospiraceae bacterium]|jgi:signal transduction histidine kinase|nr:response regulator [Nitrospiraceae bacterium]